MSAREIASMVQSRAIELGAKAIQHVPYSDEHQLLIVDAGKGQLLAFEIREIPIGGEVNVSVLGPRFDPDPTEKGRSDHGRSHEG